MKTSLLVSTVIMCISMSGNAQTSLPTSWDCSGTPPIGWSISGTTYYGATSTGYYNTAPSVKLDGTGDYVMVNFSDAPGTLTYYLRGASLSGATFQFKIEESSNGTAWTSLRAFTSSDFTSLNNVLALFADTPLAGSRYIRWIYTQKSSGNIALDDINLAIAVAGPPQEINVILNGNNVVNNGTVILNSPVSTTGTDTFIIENLGTVDTLYITAATIGGVASTDYSVVSLPDTILANSNKNLVINFTPSVAGTRSATLTIANNDIDENPYVIDLYGVGGLYSTEPSNNPTNLAFSNVKSYRFNVAYTAASPAPDGGYLVLRKKSAAITDAPADGKTYTRGDSVGSSTVAYNGKGTTFYPKNIVAATDYYFAVFAYNGSGAYINYKQDSPLSGMATSSGNMMGNEYNGISTSSPLFIIDLSTVISPHNQIYYGNYDDYVINLFASRDTTGGQKVVTCVYSGENYVYSDPFDWSILSREHTFAHSWMPTYDASNPELKEYDDCYNLFPVDYLNANQPRSNLPLGEVVNTTYTFMGCKKGTDATGKTVFEPRNEHKGDAARALFYMCVSYDKPAGVRWKLPVNQDEAILKKWHYQDPPDAWEIARNDFLDSLQGNRNPFIDSMQFACYIDFSNMTMISTPPVPCNVIGVKEFTGSNAEFTVQPNPGRGEFKIQVGNKQFAVGNKHRIEVQNVLGSTTIPSTVFSIGEGELNALPSGGLGWAIDLSSLPAGVYILKLTSGDFTAIDKLVIY